MLFEYLEYALLLLIDGELAWIHAYIVVRRGPLMPVTARTYTYSRGIGYFIRVEAKAILEYLILIVSLAGIAIGSIPGLRTNRAGIALAAAAILLAIGAISPESAASAVDLSTIALLLAMMLIVANLRLAGFFTVAGARILAIARSPRQLLGLIVAVSGLLSALFLNDTMCVMLTPLVAELARRGKRDPVPYLIGVAVSANIGSCATIVGNPQNMLIGAQSGLGFVEFFLRLAPPSIACLGLAWLFVVIAFPAEFKRGQTLEPAPAPRHKTYRPLAYKSFAAAALMLLLLVLGFKPAVASLAAAAILIITRRVKPERLFAEVDFTLLVFFSGLFVITKAVEGTGAFAWLFSKAEPLLGGSGAGPLWILSGFTALFSNVISNVPAVMLERPLIALFPDAGRAWAMLALSSTFAGNLTLLGSVANLIVAEGAKKSGIELSFGKYLRVGLPLTLATMAIGSAWIAFGGLS
jgi:Na+/H+ antiporter NhaD/arsenite permease-like protein